MANHPFAADPAAYSTATAEALTSVSDAGAPSHDGSSGSGSYSGGGAATATGIAGSGSDSSSKLLLESYWVGGGGITGGNMPGGASRRFSIAFGYCCMNQI